MYKILFLEKFNNYFNRIIKGYDTIAEYTAAVDNYYLYTKDFNFSFADNVSTEVIINDCPFEPDYMLLLDEDAEEIISRWFVLESIYTRKNQKQFRIRRDVIYDNVESLKSSPVFVQKGWLQNTDPFILNDEGMSFNEIKTRETLLKDKIGCAWIVGYIARNTAATPISLQLQPETSPAHTTLAAIASDIGTTEEKLAAVINIGSSQTNSSYFTSNINLKFRTKGGPAEFLYDTLTITYPSDLSSVESINDEVGFGTTNELYYQGVSSARFDNVMSDYIINSRSSIIADMDNILSRSYFTSSQLSLLQNYATAETLILYNGVYYKLKIVTSGTATNNTGYVVYSTLGALGSAIYNASLDASLENLTLRTNGVISVITNDTIVYLQLEEALIDSTVESLKTTITSSRAKMLDQPYDMFAIPFGSIYILNAFLPVILPGITLLSDPLIAKKIAVEIARELDASCYDVQLLPYCPMPNLLFQSGAINLYGLTEDEDFTYIKKVDANNVETNASVILWAKSNSFSVEVGNLIYPENEPKIESQCNKYRLCSPNYQGSFDFNLARNGRTKISIGTSFTADCTYKPYTPYIKVAPSFRGLYGANYGDARGLICGGDYSVPRLSDAWESYELNNKNYQNIFNRDIQHLDFEQNIERRNALVSGISGIVTGGAAGAGTGAFLGGGWGALAGGIVGTAGGGVGMGFDMHFLAQQHRENRQYAIDKFNYQLGNVKALPYTLTKIGAFNINSKIWPFLEYYTCTDEEKTALENKLKYESMTVMRIQLFGDFYGQFDEKHYFKGELIRNEEIAEDTHVYEAIYAELLKGVYI